MNALEDYGLSDRTSGNGHNSGNGHSTGAPSAAHKAWQTAKERAVAEAEARQAENRERGERERLEMIRALTDPNLSHGASRLFCLLAKAGWMKEWGGLYRDRVGAVMIDGRRLARLCGGASVNVLYRKLRKEKRDPKTGELLRRASETEGWLDELVRGGYIWISKCRIPNIPPAKWPNVYNVACHVPQQITPHLPWTDGNFGSESVVVEGCSPMENRDFDAKSTPGDRDLAENTHASHRHGTHAVTAADNGQVGHGMIAKHRSGGQAITAADNGQVGHGVTGNHRSGQQAVTAKADGLLVNPVHLRESLDKKQVLNSQRGKGSPPKLAVGDELKVPTFPPIPDDIWESKLRQLGKDTEQTLKKLKAKHNVTEREPGANIVWLETQAEAEKDRKKANALRAKAKTMRKDPDAWVQRSKIKSEALPLITAWQARSDDIKRRLASGIFK